VRRLGILVDIREVNSMTTASKTERVDLRVPADQKRLIEQAATLSGQTVSSFILNLTLRHAREVVHENAVIELSQRDWDLFLAALNDTEAKPGPALLRAAQRHKELFG
jgi:uncharacterized protein (DUF1778 family)